MSPQREPALELTQPGETQGRPTTTLGLELKAQGHSNHLWLITLTRMEANHTNKDGGSDGDCR